MKLEDCIPADRFDDAAVERAAKLGYPDINPILPGLLEWLQDRNWPVARSIGPLLAGAGAEIAPHISAVMGSDDEEWKSSVLYEVVRHLDPEVWQLIEPDIRRISTDPTPSERLSEVDEIASELLESRSAI